MLGSRQSYDLLRRRTSANCSANENTDTDSGKIDANYTSINYFSVKLVRLLRLSYIDIALTVDTHLL